MIKQRFCIEDIYSLDLNYISHGCTEIYNPCIRDNEYFSGKRFTDGVSPGMKLRLIAIIEPAVPL